MPDINDVSSKSGRGQIFSDPAAILTLNKVDVSAPSWYEALYSPMIVAEGWLGPLPRSDNPSQAIYTLGQCQTSMMCHQKARPDFFRSRCNSHPEPSRCQCTI